MSDRHQFGINGFGRIGRTTFRVWWNYHRDRLDLRMINTSGSMELESWIHLLKYDSNYGVFEEPIRIKRLQSKEEVSDQNPVLGTIEIGKREVTVTAQRDPKKLPWKVHQVETVVESTGVFNTKEKASAHLEAGAKTVLLSAPAKSEGVTTSIIGINQFEKDNPIRSNASCTTNCITPVAHVVNQAFGIVKATLTTIHSYTDDQNVQDNSHKDLRRARSAAENIIPTSTGAAKATTIVIPELTGRFDGLAVRVPTPVGSLSDTVFLVKQKTTVDEVNKAFIDACESKQWRGILATTSEPLVSSDIVGRKESSIVDLSLTQVIDGDLVKVVSWYDNEYGYCHRLIEQIGR